MGYVIHGDDVWTDVDALWKPMRGLLCRADHRHDYPIASCRLWTMRLNMPSVLLNSQEKQKTKTDIGQLPIYTQPCPLSKTTSAKPSTNSSPA